jgi:hypothetical protein
MCHARLSTRACDTPENAGAGEKLLPNESEKRFVNGERKDLLDGALLRTTTDPVRPGDFNDAAKEFGRTKDVERVCSIKRGTLYNAEKLGLVRGVLLRLRGQKSGVKLWDMRSIGRWIRSEMKKQ